MNVERQKRRGELSLIGIAKLRARLRRFTACQQMRLETISEMAANQLRSQSVGCGLWFIKRKLVGNSVQDGNFKMNPSPYALYLLAYLIAVTVWLCRVL